jgi:hypothetical protein
MASTVWPWLQASRSHHTEKLFGPTVDLKASGRSPGLQEKNWANFVATSRGPALVGGALGVAFSFGMTASSANLPVFFAKGERPLHRPSPTPLPIPRRRMPTGCAES